jgi:hypothetical protein
LVFAGLYFSGRKDFDSTNRKPEDDGLKPGEVRGSANLVTGGAHISSTETQPEPKNIEIIAVTAKQCLGVILSVPVPEIGDLPVNCLHIIIRQEWAWNCRIFMRFFRKNPHVIHR